MVTRRPSASTMVETFYLDTVSPDGVLIGLYQQCPICLIPLTLNRMPAEGEEYWQCSSCGWWKTEELIKLMMKDEGGQDA